MPLTRLAVFFGVVITISLGAHALIAWRLASSLSMLGPRLVWAVVMANAVFIPASMMMARSLPGDRLAYAFGMAGYAALGMFSLVFAGILAVEAGRALGAVGGLAWGWLGRPPLDPGRRELLLQGAHFGVLGLSGLVAAAGAVNAARKPAIKEVEVPISGLPAALDGFTIAQVTDIHIGATIQREFLETVVAEVNAIGADAVAVTGDLVDGSVAQLRDHVAPLAGLKARYGAYFVTGNHEYYSGVTEWVQEVRRLGLTPLLNEHRLIEHNGARLLMAGVTDYMAADILPSHASDPSKAAAGAPPADVRVLLAHQPRSVFAAAKAGFDLQISGHTHGGQYFPGTVLIHLAQPFVRGLGQFEKTWIYVSCGTGYWGPPFRLGAPAEITKLVLRPA